MSLPCSPHCLCSTSAEWQSHTRAELAGQHAGFFGWTPKILCLQGVS